MTTICAKCDEMLIAPDCSEFVSERLVVNLWSCTKCGDRFETRACMAVDGASTIGKALWQEIPLLLVA